MKLLIVEDDADFAQMVRELFSKQNFIERIDVEYSAIGAFDRLDNNTYDVVLTDFDLGGMVAAAALDGTDVVGYAKWETMIAGPVTILWSAVDRTYELNQLDPNDRPDHHFNKSQTDEVISTLQAINDEINEKVVKP